MPIEGVDLLHVDSSQQVRGFIDANRLIAVGRVETPPEFLEDLAKKQAYTINDTLQLGIGGIPDAVLRALEGPAYTIFG